MAILAAVLGASTAAATTCNIDLRNTGTTTAYDLALILPGLKTINQWYNGGCTDDIFSSATSTQTGGNTILHWTNPQAPIPSDPHGTSPQVHVGWTTTDNTCPQQITGYWTDQNGNQISGSFLVTVVDHAAANMVSIANTTSAPLTVSNVRYGVFSAPVSLAELNRCNQTLAANLTTIYSGSIEVKPGGVLNIPVPTCYECPVVVNYNVSASASDAVTGNWIGDITPPQQ
jgi:hypothetical protein